MKTSVFSFIFAVFVGWKVYQGISETKFSLIFSLTRAIQLGLFHA